MIMFGQFFLSEKFLFSMINNLDTPSSRLQINFGVLQIDTENSTAGQKSNRLKTNS